MPYGLSRFKDYESMIKGQWFEDALADVVAWGLVQGYPDGSLKPDRWPGFIESCVMLRRMMLGDPWQRTIRERLQGVVYLTAALSEGQVIGSGFFVAPWIVLTNAHCVSQRDGSLANRIDAWCNPGSNFSPIDPLKVKQMIAVEHGDDLALLELEAPWYAADSIPKESRAISGPLRLGSEPRQGDQVWALGHPYGLSWDLCDGRIRHEMRIINYWQRSQPVMGLSVPINGGNSGGPLVNALGQVVGVACAGVPSANSLTFAIPLSRIRALLSSNGL